MYSIGIVEYYGHPKGTFTRRYLTNVIMTDKNFEF